MITADDISSDESLFTFEDSGGRFKTYRISANNLLVRKCKKHDGLFLIGKATQESRIADAILEKITSSPEYHDADGWCQVVAVGAKVPYTEEQMERFDIPKGYHCPAKRGDLVIIPDSSKFGRHWRYSITGRDCDVIVAEWEPLVWVPSGG